MSTNKTATRFYNNNNENVIDNEVNDRDARYKQLLKKQLGENGLNIISSLSFLFMTVIIFIISIVYILLSAMGDMYNKNLNYLQHKTACSNNNYKIYPIIETISKRPIVI